MTNEQEQPVDESNDVRELARELIDMSVRRVHVLAWRDLDDPDAGGSEIHADHFMRRWQEAGLEVLHRTSHARGRPSETHRHGYAVVRRGSRLGVFPRTAASEIFQRMGSYDAVVEIWNGMPWFSPVWCRKPRILVLHHIHDQMWNQMFPKPIAWLGRQVETRWAPPLYRSSETVTLCDDSLQDLVELGWSKSRVHVAPAGVDQFFSPGGSKSSHPSVIAVGRLAPVKRYLDLLEQMILVHRTVPGLKLTIVGEGPQRRAIESWIDTHHAREWVELTGRIDDESLRSLYRQSWLITSASLAEGWGLTLTEAAGCGTPAVATDIGGHRSSVRNGSTGSLVPLESLGERCGQLLQDHETRTRMSEEALKWARSLSWDVLAANVLRPLRDDVVRRR